MGSDVWIPHTVTCFLKGSVCPCDRVDKKGSAG